MKGIVLSFGAGVSALGAIYYLYIQNKLLKATLEEEKSKKMAQELKSKKMVFYIHLLSTLTGIGAATFLYFKVKTFLKS